MCIVQAICRDTFCLLFVASKNGAWSKSDIRSFPKGFMFGVSTSAYQIEGGCYEDGKGLSIWDIASHTKPSPIDDGSTGDITVDSYHLYKRDISMLKDLGVDFYRFSISWTRILPNGFSNYVNSAGLRYYNHLINDLLKNGITPFVTMYHWDLPYELHKLGGWTNPVTVDWFVDYANILFESLGDRVKFWITINEPKEICHEGYGSDMKAPFLNMSGIAEYICAKNVLLAHAKVYHLYDEEYRTQQQGSIGIALNAKWFEPASDTIDDHQAAIDARQFDWGLYAHPIFSKEGDYPTQVKNNVYAKSVEQGYAQSRLPELSAAEIAIIRGTSDFFGLNSFTTVLTYRDASLDGMFPVPSFRDDMGAVLTNDPSWPRSHSPWLQEVPWGFRKLLLEINKLYDNPPVYILANGWSSKRGLLDEDRIQYMRNYLIALLDAVKLGCNIKAYAAWTLMDSFEWLRGYTEKFGLYEVDFHSPDKTTTPRKSAFIYKEIIRSKKLDPNYEPEQYYEEKEIYRKESQEEGRVKN
ncbi:myrosinase 1-like [Bicyclus anynana]|uniref:Myrosinase 1-like n=1 Tax=Bicyclus anynana TaxID=110368 RepID=A0ABM3M0J7_BICAN|nr:myrosinase 1-like [Bicyclus anynana]